MEGIPQNKAWSDKILWIIFGLYIAGVLFGIMHHEPWRDEAQSWLVTRDNSFSELFGT